MASKNLLWTLAAAACAGLAAQPAGAQPLEARIAQLERRVEQLEQALRHPGPSSAAVLTIEANAYCGRANSVTSCDRAAREVCANLGYLRSVPGRSEDRGLSTFLISVTCAQPTGR